MLFRWVLVLCCVVVVPGLEGTGIRQRGQCPNVKTSLTSVRKRRHLTFPDHSNVAITISLAKAFMTHAPSGWMVVMDLDVTFPLPDANFTLAHSRRKLHHKQKRDLWESIKGAVDLHNMNGQACILKSICEAKTYLAPKGKSLVHDILRSIFTVPSLEAEFSRVMEGSFDDVLDPNICERIHECPISLLNFILDLKRA